MENFYIDDSQLIQKAQPKQTRISPSIESDSVEAQAPVQTEGKDVHVQAMTEDERMMDFTENTPMFTTQVEQVND